MNAAADVEEATLRLSMDAKAMVKIGPFARGGKNRVLTKAVDHDFGAEATVTPVVFSFLSWMSYFCTQ